MAAGPLQLRARLEENPLLSPQEESSPGSRHHGQQGSSELQDPEPTESDRSKMAHGEVHLGLDEENTHAQEPSAGQEERA